MAKEQIQNNKLVGSCREPSSMVPATSVITVEVVSGNEVADWASRINGRLTEGVVSFIAAGRDLIEAKAKLKHGGFKKLFEPGVLCVDRRTAQMLIRIAEHAVLANPNYHSHLPPTLNALYALSGLDEPRVQKALEAGKVTATTTTREAKALGGKKRLGKPDIHVAAGSTANEVSKDVPKYFSDIRQQTLKMLATHPQFASIIEVQISQLLQQVQQHRREQKAKPIQS